ncbi:restriction endonuclease subunit S [Staphylococcus epidermidis]|uniref:restriction endonuclease subunit S n=2 Tax=Staphylococcus TaxID=1279 RepID=UPI00026C0299|nr:restriction endonuclease subunit S [Staphylococcus epidermidis]HDE9397374.1 restriction endonuclease subunit S [Staphylococcus aureus]EJE13898.1 type I restriction-modification enzyme, S subunit, EcoA family [Staphylococcus epidermidis NIHLM015]MBM6185159.1 restriction endonuclease subunit S [Staphylococcus epidermidis]MCG1409467.1 restriction endonuclease subunit S [Staphylococcus epidermidis]MCG1420972.1 restriction endonuclease subunit S [Staphylococcus epidermidis]
MTNEMSNVPELRFPEFDGEWEEGTIKSLVHGNLSDGDWINKEYLLPNGKYRIIQTGNISVGKYLNKEKSSKFISQSSYDELKANEVFPGDILISRLADPAGRSIIMPNINWKMVTSVDVAIIRPNKKFESYFLISILNTDKKLYDISKLVSGTSHKRISRKNLEKVKIIYPKIQEQQKIGNFFSKLDRQIELEEEKLELLEQQKKGYMQKIFSQELRFKDENNNSYPEWKIKKLEEISEFQNGKAHENFVSDTGKFILVNSKFISTESKVKKYVDKQLTPLGINDIAIVMSDVPNGKALAKCYLIENDNTFTLNQRIGRIFNIEGNSRFLFTQINRNKQLLKYDNGVGQTNLKKSEIIGIKIYWPNKREQDKIGDFFINLDSIIEKQSTKVELLKQRKKGLLQKMFV